MKIARSEEHVLGSSGLQEVQAFKIKTSPAAFKMLSSGLYSDKVLAVLREIGCNAHDAHVAAGKPDTPFEVKLPNVVDTQFYIKDHGTGLSHEDVMEMYTSYFSSTKQGSNDFTGAFGLGSKSPFSYTDSFTITSCHGGKQRTYSAHLVNGSPTIAKMGECNASADWQTGLQVGFPVKPADFAEFKQKAEAVYKFFRVVPQITGSSQIEPMKFVHDFKGYAFTGAANENPIVLMGNVRYPLNAGKLGMDGAHWRTKTKLEEYSVHLKGLVLRFEIGELQVVGSREELEYDPTTKVVLGEKLKMVATSIVDEVKAARAKIKTWKDLCAFSTMVDAVSMGMPLDVNLFELTGMTTPQADALSKACHKSAVTLPEAVPGSVISLMDTAVRRNGMKSLIIGRVTPEKPKLHLGLSVEAVIVQGCDGRGISRVRKALFEETIPGPVLLVMPQKDSNGTQSHVDDTVKKLLSTMPGMEVKKLSDLPAPAIIRMGKKGTIPTPDETVDVDGVATKMSDVPDDRKVYVVATTRSNWGNPKTHRWVDPTKAVEEHLWREMIKKVEEISKTVPNAALVKPVELHRREVNRLKMDKRPDWVEFKAHVKTVLSDKKVADEIDKLGSKGRYAMYLGSRNNGERGFLENMVYLRHTEKKAYDLYEPVLAKHDIARIIAKVHDDSKASTGNTYSAAVKKPAVIEAVELLTDSLGLTFVAPATKVEAKDLNDKYPKANEVPYHMFANVVRHAPSLADKFMSELLK